MKLRIVKDRISTTYRDRGSKFIGRLFPCADENEFNEDLQAIKAEFPDATHHCSAFRVNPNEPVEYSNDDGEPSGTAGLPILNQLKSYDVINAGIVVVRYFGGTKLGKPGLIEAYGTCAGDCLEKARLKTIISVHLYEVVYPYTLENLIHKFSLSYELHEIEADYTENIRKLLACPMEHTGHFAEALENSAHAGIAFKQMEKSFIEK